MLNGLFFLPEVYLLDEEIGIAILDLPQWLDLLPLYRPGDGHLPPRRIDLAVEKPLIEGQKTPLGAIDISGSALTIQPGLIDLQEGALLFIDRADNDPSQQDHPPLISDGVIKESRERDLPVHLLEDIPGDGMNTA
jgi:hypothetical protein